MIQPSFFNTIHEQGQQLADSQEHARRQEEVILGVFRITHEGWTPCEVSDLLALGGHHWPITSVRRAITNLTTKGELRKTSIQRQGPYGKANYVWVKND